MHYLIYIDVLFLVNFIMDYVVVSITTEVAGRCKNKSEKGIRADSVLFCLRKAAASLIGAVWVCVLLVLRLRGVLWDIVTYLGISFAMSAVTALPCSFKKLMKNVVIMYFVTCTLGGIMHVIYYYTAFGCMVRAALSKPELAGFLPVTAGALIAEPVIRWLFGQIEGLVSGRKLMPLIVIENDGRKLKLRALVDTGNSLTDPFSGRAVNVAEADAVSHLIKSYASCQYHLIPFASLGEKEGLIPVVRFDRMTVIGKKKIIVDKPLFALYSGNFTDDSYRVILNPLMLAG